MEFKEIIDIIVAIGTIAVAPAWCGVWLIVTIAAQAVVCGIFGVPFDMSFSLVIQVVIGLFISGVWGVIVDEVIALKGYNKNWFWWGCIFGFFALFVAILRKKNEVHIEGYSKAEIQRMEQDILDNGGWKCSKCGKVLHHYVGMCGCGNSKEANEQ